MKFIHISPNLRLIFSLNFSFSFSFFFCSFFYYFYSSFLILYTKATQTKTQHQTVNNKPNETAAATNKSEDSNKNKILDNEFVSDTFQTTDKDLEEVKAGMKMLGIDTLADETKTKKNCGKQLI